MTMLRLTLIGLWALAATMVSSCYTNAEVPAGAVGINSFGSDSKLLIYVANAGNSIVEIYNAQAKSPVPIGQVLLPSGSQPNGLCFDSTGALYVVETEFNEVAEYKNGSYNPYKRIVKGLSYPEFCAVDSNDNLWVTSYGNDRVLEFKHGSTKPSMILTNGISYPSGIAFDSNGNLYVANTGASFYNPNVVVYQPNGSSPSQTITKGIKVPLGLAVDSNGILYVANNSGKGETRRGDDVAEYLAGDSQPYRKITRGISGPTAITISATGYVYVANSNTNEVTRYAPGSTKPSGRPIVEGVDIPFGLALFPPALPRSPIH